MMRQEKSSQKQKECVEIFELVKSDCFGATPFKPTQKISCLQQPGAVQSMSSMDADFRQLFCAETGCEPAEFEARLFVLCLFRHALPARWFIQDERKFFREDWEMLRDIATARNTAEVVSELNRFYGRNRRDKNFFRTRFLLRVSGKRVLQIYRRLMAGREPTPALALQPEPESLT